MNEVFEKIMAILEAQDAKITFWRIKMSSFKCIDFLNAMRSGNTQMSSLNSITQSDPVVNRKIDRLNTLLSGEKQRKRGYMNMEQTYIDPIAVINEKRNGIISKIFGKSFNEIPDNKILMTVIDDKNKGVSTHERERDNFLNKIKMPDDLLYEKQINGQVETAGNDAYIRDLASEGDIQSSNNITQSDPVVNRKIDRLNTLLQGEKQRKRGLYERSF